MVPVQSSHALDKKIDGRKISDQQVEINVQRLLYDLGGNDDRAFRAFGALTRRAEPPKQIGVFIQPVGNGESRMIEADVVAKDFAQFFIRLLCTAHSISNDEGAPAVGQSVVEQGNDVSPLIHPSDLNRTTAALSLNGDDLRPAFS